MGWEGASIGIFQLTIHESWLDRMKRSKDKDYFKKKKVELCFKVNEYREEEKIEYPLLSLGKVKKVKEMYEFIPSRNFSELLFDLLIKRGFLLMGTLEFRKFEFGRMFTYYLNSPLLDDKVILTKEYKEYILETHEQYLWALSNGLEFNNQ